MGNACHGKAKSKDDHDLPPPNIITLFGLDGDPTDQKESSAVIQWEKRQKELNQEVMEKMREEFHNRPDNFILNLLIASVQFYSNYNKEKAEIRNHIRDREMAFDHKLEASKRKVLYMGGHEEISGTHVLYQPREHPYMEVPTPLQFFLVHDNIDLYPERQYEELQERQYTDLDGPGYRFCTEYSNRHPGYVRLRCVDIIPGVTRSNTYEDIYGFLKPVDESEWDPVVDPRPLRRPSLTSQIPNGQLPNSALPNGRHSLYSDFEESDNEEAHHRSPSTSPRSPANNPMPAQLKARRPSGLLPHSYPDSSQLSQLITAMRSMANGENNSLPNGDVGHAAPRSRSLSERRPSGVFPRVGPEMRRLRLTSAQTDTTDSKALLARRLTSVEEEEEDEEEEEEIREDGDDSCSSSNTGPAGLEPGEALEEVEDEEVVVSSTDQQGKQETILHARLNEGCFINRNIKMKDPSDAYGISTKTERRTYFSSERHMECFEDDFEDVAKVLGKEHLLDTSQRQGPAVLANELMIEEIGPKFHVEFIPTLLLKEWPQCAFEWPLRERRGILDPEAKVMYKWPKDINIQEAMQVGCNLVPIGHYNPKEPNRVMKIEWQIQFIKAEQILLRSLGHVQMRLLLWVEYLLRDHLEDVPCLQNQHLRYILFWMCEKDFRDWQEPRLGIKLKTYLKILYKSLSTESLPHYFVMSCNMMKSIPEKYIRQAQLTVKRIKENLPIYVMHTMSRMRMASDFYPRLNIRKLFRLVTMESFGLEHINPTLLQLAAEDNNTEENDNALRSDSEEDDGDAEEKRKLHEIRRKRKEQVEAQMAKRNSINNTKKRPSTIRLDSKVQRVKDLRAGPVLRLFARHFLAMARASNRNRAYPQAYMYLLLTGNMATLLDETGNNEDAVLLRRQVEQLNVASRGGVRDMLSSSWSVNEQHDLVPSTTPSRGSNWEFNKPPPQPPPERNSMFGMDRQYTAPAFQNIDSKKHSDVARILSNTDSDLDIMELPCDSPASSLPSSPTIPPADPAPLPEELPTLSPPTQTDSPTLTTPQYSNPIGSDVPDTRTSPTSPSPEPNFLNLRDEDADDADDESTDL